MAAAYLCCPFRIGYDPRLASLANRGDSNGCKPTLWSFPPGKLAWQWEIHHWKMYFLFKMGISIAMLVYQSVHFHPDESPNFQLLLLLSSFQLIFQVFLLLFLLLTLLAHVLETKNDLKSRNERCKRQIMRKNISIPILPYWFAGNPHIWEYWWWSIAKKSNIPWYSKPKQPWSCFILRNWKYSDSSQQKCTCILYKILYLADVKNMGPNHKRKTQTTKFNMFQAALIKGNNRQ